MLVNPLFEIRDPFFQCLQSQVDPLGGSKVLMGNIRGDQPFPKDLGIESLRSGLTEPFKDKGEQVVKFRRSRLRRAIRHKHVQTSPDLLFYFEVVTGSRRPFEGGNDLCQRIWSLAGKHLLKAGPCLGGQARRLLAAAKKCV